MKQLIRLTCCIVLLALVIPSTAAPKVYNASKFGIEPNTGANMTSLVVKALNHIKSNHNGDESVVLKFKKGVYDFHIDGAQTRTYYISNHDQDNPKIVGIVIEGMKNFTLDGSGSDFLFRGRMLPISILNSENCTIKNISIDNPNPQIAQIQILTNDVQKGEITYQVAPWVQYRIDNGKFISYGENWEHTPGGGIAFEEKTKHLVFNTSDISVATKSVTEISPRVLKAAWKNEKLIPGTVVAMRTWHRPTPGIFMSHDKNTRLENVKVHYSEGMGLIAQVCENITMRGFSVCLRGDNDPRYFTAQADATHFSGCKGVISSVGGLYENMMDDAINVHGTYLKVVKRLGDKHLIARYMHGQSWGFEWGNVGDTVQFVNSPTMELIDAKNTITSIKPYDQQQIEGAKEYEITFQNPIDPAINEQGVFGIENLEWTPQVIFADNIIRNNRARGSLFSTPRYTVVERNLFDHTSGTAILLCGDCNGWFETGACRNIMIRNNKFINSLTNQFQFTNAIISIYPEIPNLKDQKQYFHGGAGCGVTIENNLFETFDAPILYAKSIDGLIFRKNKIRINQDYPAFHWNKHRFLLERTTNVVIEDNDIEGGFDPQKDVKRVD